MTNVVSLEAWRQAGSSFAAWNKEQAAVTRAKERADRTRNPRL